MWLTSFESFTSPREAALRLALEPGLAWLDGGLEHGREGRFSFVSAAPCEVLETAKDEPYPLSLLDRLSVPSRQEQCLALQASEVPYWVGHLAYDAHPVTLRTSLSPVPVVRFARYEAWYAVDHTSAVAYLVGDDEAACERLRARLLATPIAESELVFASGAVEVTTRERHRAAVREALDLIREGEVYEINLARRFRAPFIGSALGLFLAMREQSAVPLGYFVDGGSHAILGRSMERFLRLDKASLTLTTSPIKGTLARGGDDTNEAQQLASDPKERAEHAMVVDLMRNDLSRVCQVGSVEIAELMTVLPFAGLSHLVSTVRGVLRNDVTLRSLFEQTFPPGSITGAPKERVLAAIASLESEARGVYTGAVGFIDRAGGCSFAVAIRTAVVAAGVVDYFAGGGIVADSDSERETAETELKAALFLAALGASQQD